MGALLALAANAIRSPFGRAAITSGAVIGAQALVSRGGGDGGVDALGNLIHVGGHPARRRRRRALTQSDKADIAFIAASLGPGAGTKFAMIIASRV